LVQQELGVIKKEADNPFFKSKYFDINALIDHVKPTMNKHGLLVMQPLVSVDGKPALETAIIDSESGDIFKAVTPLPENPDPQKTGSIITYFRRYALQSLLFLEAEDDDGNQASQASKPSNSYETVKDGQVVTRFRITCQTCGCETDSKFQNAKQCYDCWKKSQYPTQ
jgi:hypothetical protein